MSQADGIIFGSPVYFLDITGQLRSFIERLLFPYLVYDKNYSSLAPKKMPTAIIYTMNVTEEIMNKSGYLSTFNNVEGAIERIFTKPLVMYSNDTYQFNDYSNIKWKYSLKKQKQNIEKFNFL